MNEKSNGKTLWWLVGLLTTLLTASLIAGATTALTRATVVGHELRDHERQPAHGVQAQVNNQIIDSVARLVRDIDANAKTIAMIRDSQVEHRVMLQTIQKDINKLSKEKP